jgi:NAD(P)-dependent dehydrogenase (short-subunit alcohol dehydrogenase family)
MRVWLITGAARGLGRELVRQALAEGDTVVTIARTPNLEETTGAQARSVFETKRVRDPTCSVCSR